jgi:hypothetical protein
MHFGACPRVKSIEYYENGEIKKVEYHDQGAPPTPPNEPWWVSNPPWIQPIKPVVTTLLPTICNVISEEKYETWI